MIIIGHIQRPYVKTDEYSLNKNGNNTVQATF